MSENKPKKSFFELFWKKEEAELASPAIPSSAAANNNFSETLDKKFVEHFTKVLEDNNLPGQDYYEMKQALKAMENLPIAENAKFQAAYATLSTMGVSVNKLLETANQYIEILNREKTKFENATDEQVKIKIKSKESEIENLNQSIQGKTEQIQGLSQDITAHQQSISKLKSEIAENTSKIQSSKMNFEATLSNYVSQIQGDITKIKTYLIK